jgi:hypothetical protein
MKTIPLCLLVLLASTAQAQFKNNKSTLKQERAILKKEINAEHFKKGDFAIWLPSIFIDYAQNGDMGIKKYITDIGYDSKGTTPAISGFKLQTYVSQHWRFDMNFGFFQNTDTIKNNNFELHKNQYKYECLVGYSLRKNNNVELFNVIPQVGLSYNNYWGEENSVVANIANRTFDYKLISNYKLNALHGSVGLQVQKQFLLNRSILSVIMFGANIRYYTALNNNSIIIKNEATNLHTSITNQQDDYWSTGVFINFHIPILVSNEEKRFLKRK